MREWKWASASITASRAKKIHSSAPWGLEGELDAQQRAYLLGAANLSPVGEILRHQRGHSHTSGRGRFGHNTTVQASYEDDLAELLIPNIDPD